MRPQGPTSSGKTSLVAQLAARTGHRFVRINNHEQTDLQEYLGSYVSDEQACLACMQIVWISVVLCSPISACPGCRIRSGPERSSCKCAV